MPDEVLKIVIESDDGGSGASGGTSAKPPPLPYADGRIEPALQVQAEAIRKRVETVADKTGGSRGVNDRELSALKVMQQGQQDKVATLMERVLGVKSGEREQAAKVLGVKDEKTEDRMGAILNKLTEKLDAMGPAASRAGYAFGQGGAAGGATAVGIQALAAAGQNVPVLGAVLATIRLAGEFLASTLKGIAERIRDTGQKAAVEIGSNDLLRGEIIRLQMHQKQQRAALYGLENLRPNYWRVEQEIANYEAQVARRDAQMSRISRVGMYGEAASAMAGAQVTGLQTNMAEGRVLGKEYGQYIATKASFDQAAQIKAALDAMKTMAEDTKAFQKDEQTTRREIAALIKAQEDRVRAEAADEAADADTWEEIAAIMEAMDAKLADLRDLAAKKDERQRMTSFLKVFDFQLPAGVGYDPVLSGRAAEVAGGQNAFNPF